MEKITWKIRSFFLALIIIVFTANAYSIGVWPTEVVPHLELPELPGELEKDADGTWES